MRSPVIIAAVATVVLGSSLAFTPKAWAQG